MAGLKECYPECEIVRADDIMVALRSVKSENEIACIREGLRITEIATQEVIRHIKPGMTELQLVGIAQKTIYENGAEYEGLPMYVFSEKSTRHAISRSTYREIQKGDIVQLNLSAKVDGYSPSIGMPISMGKLAGRKREIVEFGLEAHRWTYDQLKAGVLAADVAKKLHRVLQAARLLRQLPVRSLPRDRPDRGRIAVDGKHLELPPRREHDVPGRHVRLDRGVRHPLGDGRRDPQGLGRTAVAADRKDL